MGTEERFCGECGAAVLSVPNPIRAVPITPTDAPAVPPPPPAFAAPPISRPPAPPPLSAPPPAPPVFSAPPNFQARVPAEKRTPGMGGAIWAVFGLLVIGAMGAAGWLGYQRIYLRYFVGDALSVEETETAQAEVRQPGQGIPGEAAGPPETQFKLPPLPTSGGEDRQQVITRQPNSMPNSMPNSTPVLITPSNQSFPAVQGNTPPPLPPSNLPPSLQRAQEPQPPAVISQPPVNAPPVNVPQNLPPVPPSAVVTRSPSLPPAYRGPASGVINWSGQIEKNGTVTIDGDQATAGKVNGQLPGVPVMVDVDTREFAFAEVPSPSNGWSRFTIRSKNKKHSVISITWKVLVQ